MSLDTGTPAPNFTNMDGNVSYEEAPLSRSPAEGFFGATPRNQKKSGLNYDNQGNYIRRDNKGIAYAAQGRYNDPATGMSIAASKVPRFDPEHIEETNPRLNTVDPKIISALEFAGGGGSGRNNSNPQQATTTTENLS